MKRNEANQPQGESATAATIRPSPLPPAEYDVWLSKVLKIKTRHKVKLVPSWNKRTDKSTPLPPVLVPFARPKEGFSNHYAGLLRRRRQQQEPHQACISTKAKHTRSRSLPAFNCSTSLHDFRRVRDASSFSSSMSTHHNQKPCAKPYSSRIHPTSFRVIDPRSSAFGMQHCRYCKGHEPKPAICQVPYKTILLSRYLEERCPDLTDKACFTFESFLTKVGKRDRLKLYDLVMVCRECEDAYEASLQHLKDSRWTEVSDQQKTNNQEDDGPNHQQKQATNQREEDHETFDATSGSRLASSFNQSNSQCQAGDVGFSNNREELNQDDDETQPLIKQGVDEEVGDATLTSLRASCATEHEVFSSRFKNTLKAFRLAADTSNQREQNSAVIPGGSSLAAQRCPSGCALHDVKALEEHLQEQCPIRQSTCRKGCGVKARTDQMISHESQCTGKWPLFTVEIDCAAAFQQERYLAYIVQTVRSCLGVKKRVKLKQLSPKKEKGPENMIDLPSSGTAAEVLQKDDVKSILRSIYWEARDLVEDLGFLPEMDTEFLATEGGHTCLSLELVPLISHAVK